MTYQHIDIFRGVVKYTTYQKLAGKSGYLMVFWGDMVRHLEPEMIEWEDIRDYKPEFMKRIDAPVRDLQRLYLLYDGDTVRNHTFLSLYPAFWRCDMKKSELDALAVLRISGQL